MEGEKVSPRSGDTVLNWPWWLRYGVTAAKEERQALPIDGAMLASTMLNRISKKLNSGQQES